MALRSMLFVNTASGIAWWLHVSRLQLPWVSMCCWEAAVRCRLGVILPCMCSAMCRAHSSCLTSCGLLWLLRCCCWHCCLLSLQVWDLASGTCVQTVARAHNNAITSIMMWGEVRRMEQQQALASTHQPSVPQHVLPAESAVCMQLPSLQPCPSLQPISMM